MNIPPIVGLVAALLIGLLFGGSTVYLYLDGQQMEADNRQIEEDNDLAVDISEKTAEAKESSEVREVVIKWKEKRVEIPKELTSEEINAICVNHHAPADIVQSVRSEAAKARKRFNGM